MMMQQQMRAAQPRTVHRAAPLPRVQRARVTAAAAVSSDRFIPKWPECYANLCEKRLQTISAQEASSLLATGKWVLLDVRRPDQHDKGHPEGAVSVPMYRLIDMSKPDPAKLLKVVAFSFNGVQPIESNTDFVKQAVAAAGGKSILIICDAGGTMKATVNFPSGKASRSLQAAWKLLVEGGLAATNVAHVEAGLVGWYNSGLPMTGDYTPDLGRTPMAAAEPTLQNGGKPAEASKKNWWGS